MGNLVSHDARELRLFLSAEDQAAVHIKKAAGQRESVDFVGIDDFDGEGNARIGIAHQVLANAIDVFRNDGVVNELGGALNFLSQLLAEGDFAFERKKVNALANVTVTDGFDVFLGVLGSDGVLLRDRLGASRLLRLLLGGRRCWLGGS